MIKKTHEVPTRSVKPLVLVATACLALTATAAAADAGRGARFESDTHERVSTSAPSSLDEQLLAVADAGATVEFGPDVIVIASQYGITPQQADTQLALQDAMDTIDYAALDPNFADIRSTIGAKFAIEYRSAAAPTKPVRAAIKSAGLAPFTVFLPAPYTDAQLRAAHAAFQERHPNLKADTMIDPVAGKVVVTVPDLSALPSARAKFATSQIGSDEVAVGVPVEWQEGDLAVAALGGGSPMNPECTAGFTVKRLSDNVTGIATAAHCANVLSYANYSLQFMLEAYHHNYDVQWHHSPLVSWDPTFFDGSGVGSQVRTVQSRKQRPDMNVGDPVCKNGKTTGYTCGTITTKSACPNYVPYCSATFIRVRRNGGGTMSWAGDSGGPVFFNNAAWGFVSGRADYAGGQDLLFMPQQFVDGLGVQVMIG